MSTFLLRLSAAIFAVTIGSPWAQESKFPSCPKDHDVPWNNCFGPFSFADGGKYVGEFKDGKPDGQGAYTFVNGDKYVGEFRNAKPNGQGTFTFANGNKYVGKFKDEMFSGLGTFSFADGRRYAGEFMNDKRNGQGTFTYANGDKYVGEWKDGKRNGQGTLTFADGGKYVGQYRDGKRNGQGTATFADGGQYIGEFKDEMFSGQGSYSFADGGKYIGEFKDGRRNGQGTYTFGEGEKYVGEWKDNRFEGTGSHYDAKGQLVVRGTFANDKLVRASDVDPTQRQQAKPLPVTLFVGKRVALIIGNSNYKTSPLDNPVNDAKDVAAALRGSGFETQELVNATRLQMLEATRAFERKVVNSDVALIYYAGHGTEVKGKNYMIPVGANIEREYELSEQAYDAAQWLDMLEGVKGTNAKRVNILILDACRNNPLTRGWRSSNVGLARMDAPVGTFLAYSTAPGKVASDGNGRDRNSPFAKHLVNAIKQPNVPIEQVFKQVRGAVIDETKGDQTPWDSSSLIGDFYFTVKK